MILDIPRNLYDFQSNYLRLGENQLHYLDEGHGSPVVMVHGNPSWSFMYRNLARSLRNQFRVIVPDHIGCGLSDKPDDRHYHYTLENRILDLENLLDHLGIRSEITFVLHDWGGLIGLGYATKYPERISKIVLLNTAAFHVPNGKKLHWSIRFCRTSSIAAFMIRKFNAFAFIASHLGCRQNPMPKTIRKAYISPYDSWSNRIATLRFVQDIPLEPEDTSFDMVSSIQSGLSKLENKPILICWGEKDFVFNLDFLEEWGKIFPSAHVLRLKKAGHYVLEDAFGEIQPQISGFLGRRRGKV